MPQCWGWLCWWLAGGGGWTLIAGSQMAFNLSPQDKDSFAITIRAFVCVYSTYQWSACWWRGSRSAKWLDGVCRLLDELTHQVTWFCTKKAQGMGRWQCVWSSAWWKCAGDLSEGQRVCIEYRNAWTMMSHLVVHFILCLFKVWQCI